MVLIKNPFKSKIGPNAASAHAASPDDPLTPPYTVGPTTESPRPSMTIKRTIEPEYKLSSVSPEGTFMPPSPPEKTSFMSRFKTSSATAAPRSSTTLNDGSGFVIPRESFDGYRRSFDIRPSMEGTGSLNDGRPSRSSLDLLSTTLSASPRRPSHHRLLPLSMTKSGDAATGDASLAPPLMKDASEDNDFEEVRLDEDLTSAKKKHFWSRTAAAASFTQKKTRDDANELKVIDSNRISASLDAPSSQSARVPKHDSDDAPLGEGELQRTTNDTEP